MLFQSGTVEAEKGGYGEERKGSESVTKD